MTTIINAVSGTGLTQSADGSGIVKLQSNGSTTNALAWVNFNGTGTVAIRSSYNVSSITDNGTGDYTINFTNAFSDANYAAVGQGSLVGTDARLQAEFTSARTTSAYRFVTANFTGVATDSTYASVAFFGN